MEDHIANKLLEKADSLDTQMGQLVVTVDRIDKSLGKVDERVRGIETRIDDVEKKVDNLSDIVTNRIAPKVIQIESRLDDFVTKEEFRQGIDQTLGSMDRFVKLHETLDHELVALRHKYDRLDERLLQLEKQAAIA